MPKNGTALLRGAVKLRAWMKAWGVDAGWVGDRLPLHHVNVIKILNGAQPGPKTIIAIARLTEGVVTADDWLPPDVQAVVDARYAEQVQAAVTTALTRQRRRLAPAAQAAARR